MSKRLTVVIDDNTYERFQKACTEDHSDISKTIRRWIESYLNKRAEAMETQYKKQQKRRKKGITFQHR